MALIVETGGGLPNAESYISVADANTYWANHASPAAWTTLTVGQVESALRYATMWVDDNFDWIGVIKYPGDLVNTAQALAWPRLGATSLEGRLYDGTIPVRLQAAVCELAFSHVVDGGLDKTFYNAAPGIESVQAGPVNVHFRLQKATPSNYTYVCGLLYDIAIGGGRTTILVRS